MPPITPVPMSCWLAAPAPVAIASGKTPAMKASEVIRIGPQPQPRGLPSPRPRGSAPLCSASSANCTIRMAFLADSPIVVSRPDLEVDVVVEAAQRRRQHRAEHAQRHHQDHRERDRPALVERGQAQEHHQHRERVEDRRLRAATARSW